MDIQLASNFERYLYFLNDCNSEKLEEMMAVFTNSGSLEIGAKLVKRVQADFAADRVDDQATLTTINNIWQKSGYILDPHTATGVCAAERLRQRDKTAETIVCLATAHPAKFPDAVAKAIGRPPAAPPAIAALENLPCRSDLIKADTDAVKDYIREKLGSR
jgi:threonine synthase